jgi:hypothetical protein
MMVSLSKVLGTALSERIGETSDIDSNRNYFSYQAYRIIITIGSDGIAKIYPILFSNAVEIATIHFGFIVECSGKMD